MKILFILMLLAVPSFGQFEYIKPPPSTAADRYITAQAGDTVTKLAVRHRIDPLELAKLNGLLPNSVLGAGRKVRVPGDSLVAPNGARVCNVTTAASPSIRGAIRLGMPKAEYDALFVDVALRSGGIPGGFRDGERFKGVYVDAQFYADRVVFLSVVYENRIRWESEAEFAYVIAEEFKLPVAGWRTSRLGLGMVCDGFTIEVKPNQIEMRDDGAYQAKVAAEYAADKAEEGRKKKGFKP